MTTNNLSGKNIVIIGGTAGIGLATAVAANQIANRSCVELCILPYLSHHNGGARYQPSLGEVGLDLVRVSSLASADDLPGGRHVR